MADSDIQLTNTDMLLWTNQLLVQPRGGMSKTFIKLKRNEEKHKNSILSHLILTTTDWE